MSEALGEANPAVQFLGTDNVAMSNGETWKRQRKVKNGNLSVGHYTTLTE